MAAHAHRWQLTAYDPAPWQNFYVMTGGAAAAPAGLLFVAMSLHAKTAWVLIAEVSE